MKVLYILPNLNVGGVSRIVNDLATGMLNKGHQVVILTLNAHDPIVKLDNRIKLIQAKIAKKSDLLKGVAFIKKVIQTEQPDIVHSHTVYAHLFTRAASIFYKKAKYIASEHGTMNHALSKGIAFKLMKKTNFLSHLMTNVSQKSVESYIQNGLVKQMKCIYNGVDFEKFHKKTQMSSLNKILYVGRISKEKNLKLLIDVVDELKDAQYSCDIIGDGDQLQTIQDYASTKANTDRIHFLGKRVDVPEIIKNYDILFLTSYTEGLPTVLIEAIAANILVLSTDCGGVKEILEDFNYLVAQNDDKDDFLTKFYCLEKLELNSLMNQLHKKVQEKFSKENMIISWEKVYMNILN